MVTGPRSVVRRSAVLSTLALLAASLLVVVGATQVAAEGKNDKGTVKVEGGLLAGITASPLTLTPAFSPTITDYVLRCQAGANTVKFALTGRPGARIKVGDSHGQSVTVEESLIENQALVISAVAWGHHLSDSEGSEMNAGGRVNYWIRCLPHDFPQLSVNRSGNPPPGWYLTSDLNVFTGNTRYVMVLDNNGTPVWYRKPFGSRGLDVTPLPDGTIAWWSGGVFEEFNLRTRATRFLSSPDLPVDVHELHVLGNGDVMILSYPTKPNVDLSALGLGSSAAISDCVIEELNPAGAVVWRWRASDHISPSESLHPFGPAPFDIYHCNSIDTDPVSGNVLLSSRHTDAVYLIDKTTGDIMWKLGGNAPNHDHAQILAVVGDPEGVFHAQHDARFQPNGDVSLYDDQSWNPSLAARGVEYHINTASGTAALVWSYESPDGLNSRATGSFRRLSDSTDNVVAWGFKDNSPLFTEVDAHGRVLLSVTFGSLFLSYRVIKVSPRTLNHELLRATAGLSST